MKTLSSGDIEGIHAFLAKEFGGDAGLRDGTTLKDLVARVYAQKDDGILGVAARLMEGIVNQAPFATGNARTAFFVADVLIRLNGFYFRCDNVLALKFFSALLGEQRFTYEYLLPWAKTNAVKL